MQSNNYILVLYSEFMPYNFVAFSNFVVQKRINIKVVYWNSPLVLDNFCSNDNHTIEFYKKESISNLLEWVTNFNIQAVFVSGWMDSSYMDISKYFMSKNVKVICGFDSQWYGSFRQYIAIFFSFILFKPYFSHLFVAGVKQYEFGMKMGYSTSNILQGALTCDVNLFTEKINYSTRKKRIIFIGRLEKSKGVDILVTTFCDVLSSFPDWELFIFGNGSLKFEYSSLKNIHFMEYADQKTLASFSQTCSFFVLPSRYEPWGVVVHEMASSGMPLLLSNICGAAHEFLIDGYNGFVFDHKIIGDFKIKLIAMMSLEPSVLINMGENSRKLASRITPDLWASRLFSLIK